MLCKVNFNLSDPQRFTLKALIIIIYFTGYFLSAISSCAENVLLVNCLIRQIVTISCIQEMFLTFLVS